MTESQHLVVFFYSTVDRSFGSAESKNVPLPLLPSRFVAGSEAAKKSYPPIYPTLAQSPVPQSITHNKEKYITVLAKINEACK